MLTLHLDRARFDRHLASVTSAFPGLVAVAKGNGYGLGLTRLADETANLGMDTIAAGTASEAEVLAARREFRRILVLTPLLPGDTPSPNPEVVHTVASMAAVPELHGRGVVVECRTSLRRHGIAPAELPGLAAVLGNCRFEGFGFHLPINRPDGVDPAGEITTWMHQLVAAGLPVGTIWVSHLSSTEVADLTRRHPGTTFRSRIGTKLWLGDRGALAGKARVLDVERLARGERFGYRQRRAPRGGHLVVASGGTAHGIGLAAPRSLDGVLPRAKALAEAGLELVNLARSPFSWAGRRRWFAEPPHMQVSLLWLPEGVTPPRVGDRLGVDTRMTTTTFDAVVEE